MASSNGSDPPPLGGQSDGLEDGSWLGVGRTATLRRAIEQQASGTVQNPKSITPTLSASGSGANSPKSSRESSPIRPSLKNVSTTSARITRSRKNSHEGRQEFSPSRAPSLIGSNTPTVPSAAAVQRALSAQKPQLQPTGGDSSAELPKANLARSGDTTPHWPVSPRLKSPPPPTISSRNTLTSPRKAEHDTNAPNISVKRPGPFNTTVSDSHLAVLKSDSDHDEGHSHTVPRPATRGASVGSALETVQESSLPATPSIGPAHRSNAGKLGEDSRPEAITEEPTELSLSKSQKPGSAESGSDSGGTRSGDAKAEDTDHLKTPIASNDTTPTAVFAKRSFTNLNPNKVKGGGEGSIKNMTVETETVSSVPQVALGVATGDRGASGRGDGGSLRLKPSNETIRPKREKKKSSRKPASINTGTVSSKADIFEAKVATAVDEANSSDSEETFVYESNPPEQPSKGQHRYHSRTPSQTSMASQVDHHGRARGHLNDGNLSVVGKRSMKFTNNTHNSAIEGDAANQSIGRGNGRVSGSGATPRHHHIGRHGRGAHASIFDGDSPFTQAGRSPTSAGGTGYRLTHSRPSSPRNPKFKAVGSPKKSNGEYGYDFDAEGADDERTPLVGSVRINRRHGRRPNSTGLRHVEYLDERDLGFFGRHGACLTVTILLFILILGIAAFLVALTKPLFDLSVKHLENVLASEQEIMLDLHVKATNPNLFAITVGDMDVNIFAKSTHVGSEEVDIQRLISRRGFPWHRPADQGIDEGNDPIRDPEGDSQTMLLGRIFEFDSPLIFDSSPFQRKSTTSIGEVRLAKPGNQTEEGGSARWERVLQHPFDLIVRGVLKYQLPLSSRTRSAPIGASFKVFPKDDVDDGGAMRTKRPKPLYQGDETPDSHSSPDANPRDGVQPYKFVA